MRVSLIAALDKNHLIGANGGLPWRLPADLQWFKSVTMGKPIIMGRTTHESIDRPLPGRHNIVITRNQDYQAPGCTVVHTVAEALSATENAPEVMVIGGSTIYRQFLPLADRLYLTLIDATFSGDTYFPEFDEREWDVVSEERHEVDEKNPYPFRFVILDRKRERIA